MGKEMVRKRPMKEILYRESRVASAIGNPAKFSIIDTLLKKGPLPLSEISEAIHRSKSATCYHLSKLKSLEIVRYETQEKGTLYWIKYPKELKSIMNSLNLFVKRSFKGVEHEV